MDEWSNKKKFGLVAIIGAVFLFLSLFTSAGPGHVQKWIDGHPESTKAPWLQLKLAGLYGVTLRREEKLACYDNYLDIFGPDNPIYDEDEYVEIEYQFAVLTAAARSKDIGLRTLQQFMDDYPRHPRYDDASKEWKNLRLR